MSELIDPFTQTLQKYGYIKPSGDVTGIEEPLADKVENKQSCNTCIHQEVCRCFNKLDDKISYQYAHLEFEDDDVADFLGIHCKKWKYGVE